MRPPRDPDDLASLKKDGLIDPADTVAGKRQKRKKRKRPEPRPELKDWKPGARKRADGRPFPPDIMLEPAGMDEEFWTAPHKDDELWRLQLADAFGTRSMSVIWTFLEQMERLCGKNIWDETAHQWRRDEHEFSAALAMINSLKPRNELEAAHAAQMVAVHLLTMKVAARAIRYEYDTRTASMAGKLARTFTMQREALERLRKPNRTSRQSIKVSRETHHHQHIHVHRGDQQNDGQPYGREATLINQRTALPSPDEAGDSMPLPCDEREACLPHPRRKEPRRAKGRGQR